MADFNQPSLTSLYTDMVDTLKARDVDSLKWLDGTTSTNVPSGAKRWNSTNNYFEKYTGSAWVPLATKYSIDVDKVDGCTVNDIGVSTTDLWSASKISNALSAKLNTSAYTAADVLTKLKTVDGTTSGLDADLLDGMHAVSTSTGNSVVSRDTSGNFSANIITATLNGNSATATTAGACTGNSATATTAGACTGNSATAYGLQVHTARNNEANKVVRTDGSGYIQAGYINSSSGNEKNNTTTPYVWGANGTDDFLRTYATAALNVGRSSKASTLANGGGDGTGMTFSWTAQAGQPELVWGGSDGVNTYAYDPRGFNVNSALNGVTASSTGLNGYTKIGNIIIQWGTQTPPPNSTTQTYNFPIVFPTSCLTFVTSLGMGGNIGVPKNDGTGGRYISTSQYQMTNHTSSSAVKMDWIAIGY